MRLETDSDTRSCRPLRTSIKPSVDTNGTRQMQDVVGLGGSAGSIEALKTFFSYMPEDSGLAFVVVLYLSPEYESGLAGVLQKWTVMPVIG
jgi:chemotaxis response regulator CheB